MDVTVDIEPTNRCNASCHFCPRDATPHQGLMKPDVFDQALVRASEFRSQIAAPLDWNVTVSLCGLGEPLLNKHTPSWVGQVRDEGFACAVSSNGALLNEKRGQALLDARLSQILINVGDTGDEYESVYKLPFDKTRNNVIAFNEMAGDECEVTIVLVDHRRDRDHLREMVKFWKGHGLHNFMFLDVINRGGALFVDHMDYDQSPLRAQAEAALAERGKPLCGAPFGYMFIGYDGEYYLCCSDWKKQVPLGSVFDSSLVDVTSDKLRVVMSGEPVCATCNLDPVNRLTDSLRASQDGDDTIDVAAAIEAQADGSRTAWEVVAQLEAFTTIDREAAEQAGKRLRIPVRAL